MKGAPISPKSSADAGMTLELLLGSLLLTTAWGMAQPVIKGAYAGVTPYAMIWMRCCTGVLTLTLYRFLMRTPERVTHNDPWKEKGHRILNALMHNAYVWFLYQGMFGTAAARASVLLYTQPVWVMLLSAVFLTGERITLMRGLGFATAMAGTVTVFSNSLEAAGSLRADFYILVAAAGWAMQTIHYRRYLWNSDVVSVARWSMLIGAPTYFLLSFSQPDFGISHIGGAQIFAVLYMGVIASALLLAYWGHLLLRYSPAKISVFFFMTPIIGVVGSGLYLGERLGGHLLIGAAFTAAGAWLVTGERR